MTVCVRPSRFAPSASRSRRCRRRDRRGLPGRARRSLQLVGDDQNDRHQCEHGQHCADDGPRPLRPGMLSAHIATESTGSPLRPRLSSGCEQANYRDGMDDGVSARQGFNTRAIHAGQEPDSLTGAVTVPIYATSTYKQDGVGGLRGGYEYSRSANPTRTALEDALAALEGGVRGLAFASGLAAEDTLLRAICQPGDHVVVPDDAYGGTFVVGDAGLAERLTFHQNAIGAVAGPFDAWLVLRGIKTLGVRMDRHCANAAVVASFLAGHSAVAKVYYPGLPEHPGHDLAAKQMSGFGGMVSFTLRGGEEAALKVCELASVFILGESLGGVESLIEHPGRMTHASAAGSPLEVPSDLIRLSVGIEDVEDLIEDLQQALT